MKETQKAILNVANKEVGKQEIPKGSNWGVHVQGYLKSVGITFPAAWCAAFVYWVLKQAELEKPVPRTGGVLRMWREAPAIHRVVDPQPGDVFIMDYGKGLGHTGFIERVEGTKLFTIEGNTNDEGSREGYEVAKRVRERSKCVGFLRFW